MSALIDKIKNLPRMVALGLLALIGLIIFVYYPAGMIIVHHIDDSPDFAAESFEIQGGSHAVSIAEALVDREINQHRWVAMDPFFYPGSMLTRMPAYQRGIMTSVARFTTEMYDHIGRTRGSSQADADLEKAKGLLNYQPGVWMFDFSTSWFPTTSSATQYRAGLEALQRYNERLSKGQAVFERRADNLIETLDRMASDLGSSSATIAQRVDEGSALGFTASADLYYNNKGRLAANYLLLRELGKDYEIVIKERQLEAAWSQMLDSLRDGMELSNFLVINAAPDSQLLPNHLAAQGFYLMRARTQMREITNILLK